MSQIKFLIFIPNRNGTKCRMISRRAGPRATSSVGRWEISFVVYTSFHWPSLKIDYISRGFEHFLFQRTSAKEFCVAVSLWVFRYCAVTVLEILQRELFTLGPKLGTIGHYAADHCPQCCNFYLGLILVSQDQVVSSCENWIMVKVGNPATAPSVAYMGLIFTIMPLPLHSPGGTTCLRIAVFVQGCLLWLNDSPCVCIWHTKRTSSSEGARNLLGVGELFIIYVCNFRKKQLAHWHTLALTLTCRPSPLGRYNYSICWLFFLFCPKWLVEFFF